VLLVAGLTFGGLLTGVWGSGVAGAAPPTPVSATTPVISSPAVVSGASVAPLSKGWIASTTTNFGFPVGVSITDSVAVSFGSSSGLGPLAPTVASGATYPAASTGANVLRASMRGQLGTYTVTVSLPVGQTIALDRTYESDTDSASVVVTGPGSGCASQGFGGIADFTVNQLRRSGTPGYAVQFLCFSSVALVQGALAYNVVPTTAGQGYYTYGSDGSITGFGNDSYLSYLGTLAATDLNQPIVGMATTPDGGGYWLVASDGGIFAFGDAGFYGSMGARPLNKPIVGIAPTPNRKGYWLVASDGGIFAFGDAAFHGSMGGTPLNQPIVGMTASPNGGYRMVASDGGIFAFDAPYYGSMGGKPLNQPIVAMTATPNGEGYWLVASDGGIFSFGKAAFYGSTGSIPLNVPISGMATTSNGGGYWLVGGDGGVFAFGNAPFFGSLGDLGFSDVVGIAT